MIGIISETVALAIGARAFGFRAHARARAL